MATVDEILAQAETIGIVDDLFIINPNTRTITTPAMETVFGVESDMHSERKYFLCPRYVGNNLDLSTCYIRVNFRNANGDEDSYLVDDVEVVGDDVKFSWLLSRTVTLYEGTVTYVICANHPDGSEWNTTQATGKVLIGLEPDTSHVIPETSDMVSQLIAKVEQQITEVENAGAAQITAVETAATNAQATAVAEIEAKGVNTLGSIPEDYTALSEAVEVMIQDKAPAIVCSSEGSVISLNDSSDLMLEGLRVFGKSTQDGTPTPDAPVDIVSVENPVVTVCRRNLLPISYKDGTSKTHCGLTYTVNDDGSIHVVGTVTDVESYFVLSDFNFGESSVGKGQTNGEYVWSDCLYNGPSHYTMLYFPQGDVVDQVCYPQVELGTEVTQWESTNGQTITVNRTLPGISVTSGGNYTDSDGQQWICDEVDFERGVYVQRVKQINLKNVTTWRTWGVGYSSTENTGFYVYDDSLGTVTGETLCTFLSYNKYAYGGYAVGVQTAITGDQYYTVSVPNTILSDTSSSDAAIDSFKNWLQERDERLLVTIKPVETPLSESELAAYRALHTNKPNTTILNDSGAHMAVAYVADTKLYIDNKIAALIGG